MKTFSLVVGFALVFPSFLKSAQKNHTKNGYFNLKGELTPQGITHFTARAGEKVDAKTYKAFSEACTAAKYPLEEQGGAAWPTNVHKSRYPVGGDKLSRLAFFFALCDMLERAQKAATVAAKAPAKATTKASATKATKAPKKALTVTA